MHASIIAAILGTAVALISTGAAARPIEPQHVSATAPQLFELAQRLGRRGAFGEAHAILAALSDDPNPDIRNEARFRRSKLLESEGSNTAAAVLLRRILDEKPGALPVRLELAQLLDRMGDKEGAWREIRAAQAIGLPPAVARLVDRYSQTLRAQRPFGASLEIALAPDSNINRATRSDTLGTVLGDFEISDESKAKSGTGLSLHGQAYRRFALGESGLNVLARASGFADLYKTKQFNDIAADLAIGPELDLGPARLNFELGAAHRWFGQKPFLRSARAAASLSAPVGRRVRIQASASAALVDNRLNDLQDGRTYSGRIGVERALSPTAGLAGSLSLDRQSLRDPGYSTIGWRAGLAGWHDLGRLTLTASAELRRLHADKRLLLFPDKRADRYSRLSLGATFRQLQVHGFAPVARISLERNRSSIAFYDYRRVRSELGIERAF